MKRTRTHWDPTAERAQLSPLGPALESIVDDREVKVLVHLLMGLSFPETARRLGLDSAEAHVLLDKVLSRLRHPSRAQPLHGELDDTSIFRSAELRRLTTTALDSLRVPCPRCGHRFLQEYLFSARGGRPQRYCSNACRQAAYRARRRAVRLRQTPAASPSDGDDGA